MGQKPITIRSLYLIPLIGVNILLTLVMVTVFTRTQRKALVADIDNTLFAVATLAKELLPEAYLDRISEPGSVPDELYQRVVTRHNRLCVALGLEYIWSVMESRDGRVVFTTATSPDKETANRRHAAFLEEHTNQGFYRDAFRIMRPFSCSLTDKWGALRVALIPYADARGNKHLFGASIRLDAMDRRLRGIVWRSLLFGTGLFFFFLVCVLFITRWVTHPLQRLTSTIRSIASGESGLEAEEKGAAEIRTLARHFNRLHQLVRGRISDLETSNVSLIDRHAAERRQAQVRLDTSEQRYRNLLNFAVDGILIGSADGYITDANECACALFGLRHEEMIGKHITAMPFTADTLMEVPFRFDLVHAGETVVRERVIRRPDGSRVVVEIHSKAMPDGTLQSIYRDITERKRAQALLESANHLLEQRVRERTAQVQKYTDQLRALTARLMQAEEHERRRIANMLHEDLQQTLAAARMLLGVASETVRTQAARTPLERVDQMLEEAFRLTRSLAQELAVSALTDGGLPQALEWVVRQMREKFGLAVDLRCGEGVCAAREEICQCLCLTVKELLFNVVKHAGTPHAEVDVRLTGTGVLRMSVRDAGRGFDASFANGIPNGTGIGLFGVRERVEGLGGRVTVQSEVGRGTEVVVAFAPQDPLPAEGRNGNAEGGASGDGTV